MGLARDMQVLVGDSLSCRKGLQSSNLLPVCPRKLKDVGNDLSPGLQTRQDWEKQGFQIIAFIGIPGDKE
ncbi:hypothetical protein GCM10027454_09760 [Algoriphagus aestuariicola]